MKTFQRATSLLSIIAVAGLMATTDVTLTDPAPFTGCAFALAGAPGISGIPTLSEWSMVLLAVLLALAAFATMRRPSRSSR